MIDPTFATLVLGEPLSPFAICLILRARALRNQFPSSPQSIPPPEGEPERELRGRTGSITAVKAKEEQGVLATIVKLKFFANNLGPQRQHCPRGAL